MPVINRYLNIKVTVLQMRHKNWLSYAKRCFTLKNPLHYPECTASWEVNALNLDLEITLTFDFDKNICSFKADWWFDLLEYLPYLFINERCNLTSNIWASVGVKFRRRQLTWYIGFIYVTLYISVIFLYKCERREILKRNSQYNYIIN